MRFEPGKDYKHAKMNDVYLRVLEVKPSLTDVALRVTWFLKNGTPMGLLDDISVSFDDVSKWKELNGNA